MPRVSANQGKLSKIAQLDWLLDQVTVERRQHTLRVKPHRRGSARMLTENGRIAEEIGLDDEVTALQQLGLIGAV